MSKIFKTSLGTEIGSMSIGPIVEGIRHFRFTWHVNPLDFYLISQERPFLTRDDNDTILSFEDFLRVAKSCQIQEVDIREY